MSKTIFVSNRLPVTVKKDQALHFQKSIGGLATGLKGYHKQGGSIWIGWPGIPDEVLTENDKEIIYSELLAGHQCLPVFLHEEEIELYYNNFCNKTIWPLFHYFTSKAEYDIEAWEAYKYVNRKFYEAVRSVIEDKDIIWIHDYQLMLLPLMIKENFPDTQVGFFLHIPFPSFEIYRLLIWREEILRGILGADLIGFHTYDYARHFLSSARRLLGLDSSLNRISYEDRYVQVDAFPMGIDYGFFSRDGEGENLEETRDIISNNINLKMILSIDRLDYTKGIPERIKSFGLFLAQNPEYLEKVRLNLIVAPSRIEVDTYAQLKKEINELVSEINGKYGTFSWMPIWFFYRSFSQESLITLYKHADVLLVTPLRDGMNLVAKEYIAARTDYKGMVVVSETAGAASELGEAVVVNANDYNAIADGIKTALAMPLEEKIERNKLMHRRIQRYNVEFWAEDFLNTLKLSVIDSAQNIAQRNIEKNSQTLEQAYSMAQNRVLFLDYDGTLVGFNSLPDRAKPDEQLLKLLMELTNDPRNTVVLISGRERHNLAEWFRGLNLHIIASHGLWIRHPDQTDWTMTISLDNDWKDSVRNILELYTDRMPGSFVEEKDYSLVWHYRQCDPDMVGVKLSEVRETLLSMIQSSTLGIQEGNKILEIKDNRVNKGYTASNFIGHEEYDFIFAVGDDYTDEDLFSALPQSAYTVKIGVGNTNARYYLKSWISMRLILKKFVDISNSLSAN